MYKISCLHLIFLYFAKTFTPKKWKEIKTMLDGFHLHEKKIFIIWCLEPFIKVFPLLTWTHRFFNMSKYWQGNSLGRWNDGIYIIIYVLNMCTRKLTISRQVHQNSNEILIVFDEKPNTQISKIITHDVSWSLIKFHFIKSTSWKHITSNNWYELHQILYAPIRNNLWLPLVTFFKWSPFVWKPHQCVYNMLEDNLRV
jgi:hypothetical protein